MKDETMPPLPEEISRYKMVPTLKRMHELFYEYARAYAELVMADEKRRRMEAEMMAHCTTLLRDDLIQMGLIGNSCPPMFLTEGICAAIRREVAKEREVIAIECETQRSDVEHLRGWLSPRHRYVYPLQGDASMRKKCKRKVYATNIDVIARAIESVRPTTDEALMGLRTVELLAIDAFAKGIATQHDFRQIADMLNVAETLVDMGVGAEVRQVCEDAQAALLAVHARNQQGKGLILRGPELTALKSLYSWHDAQRTAIGRSVYEKAIERTTNRIRSGHPSLKAL